MKSVFIYIGLFVLVAAGSGCRSSRHTAKAPVPAPVHPRVEEKKPEPPAPLPPVKKRINVRFALVMPFELSENFKTDTSQNGYAELEISQGALAGLHFYEGARLAADSLLSDSIHVTITGYDTPSDSAGTARLIGGGMLHDFDYVIAGVSPALAATAAAAAHRAGVHLLLTQAASADAVTGHPDVAIAGTSTFSQCKEMAAWISDTYPAANVILVYRKIKREDELAEVFRSNLSSRTDRLPPVDFDATTKTTEELQHYLHIEKRNIIVVVSSDEAFVKTTLTGINAFEMSGIYVCGLPTWTSFESIDFMNMENLRYFVFDNNFIDPSDPSSALLRKMFISKYNTDPLPQAYNGFEMVMALATDTVSGLPFCEKLSHAFKQNKRYHFISGQPGSGCENVRISVLEIADYSLKKAE
ncbi:MAG TPA: hypothetical protein VFW78_06210 [Bacteroidia bacterium]|nr:hypothetical protein [Bacteroidia bacterium]